MQTANLLDPPMKNRGFGPCRGAQIGTFRDLLRILKAFNVGVKIGTGFGTPASHASSKCHPLKTPIFGGGMRKPNRKEQLGHTPVSPPKGGRWILDA